MIDPDNLFKLIPNFARLLDNIEQEQRKLDGKLFTELLQAAHAGLTLCAFKRGHGQRTFLDDYKEIHALAVARGWEAKKETLAEFVGRCVPEDSERNYLIG